MSRRPPIGAEGRGLRIAGVAGLALGQAAAAGVAAFATRDVFGALHDGTAAPVGPLAAIALAGVLLAGLRVAERAVAERVGCDYAAALRERLFLHVARTPPSALARRSRGGLALRFVGDLGAVRGWVAQGLARLVSAAITLPASILVLFLLDPRLGLAASLCIGVALAAMAMLGGPLARAHRRLRRHRARIASEMTERLSHGAALRLTGRVGAERKRLAARSDRLADLATARARLAGVARAIPDAAAGCAAAGILAATFVTGAPPATAAGALAALGLAVQPLRRLAEVHDRNQAWRVASAQIERALAAKALPSRSARRAAPKTEAPALALEGVRIGDGGEIDGTLAPGEIVALTGAGGSGKSALLTACAGLERAAAGRIRVFGRAPPDLPTGVVAYCGPASPILRGTLRRNLSLGLPRGVSERASIEALEAAGLGSLVARLGGIGGRIAEGGRDLSASERARLRLARALLDGAALLLVDAEDLGFSEEMVARLAGQARGRGGAALVAVAQASDLGFADRQWRIGPV